MDADGIRDEFLFLFFVFLPRLFFLPLSGLTCQYLRMRVVYQFEEQLRRRDEAVAEHAERVGNVTEAEQPRLTRPFCQCRPLRSFLVFLT